MKLKFLPDCVYSFDMVCCCRALGEKPDDSQSMSAADNSDTDSDEVGGSLVLSFCALYALNRSVQLLNSLL